VSVNIPKCPPVAEMHEWRCLCHCAIVNNVCSTPAHASITLPQIIHILHFVQ